MLCRRSEDCAPVKARQLLGAHRTLPYSISPPAPQLAIPSLSIIFRYIHSCKHSLSMTTIILIYHLYLIILIY